VIFYSRFSSQTLNHPSYQDPFEEYKTRLANKLAKRAESAQHPADKGSNKSKDDVNVFGLKLGSSLPSGVGVSGNTGGVGKYLNAAASAATSQKRPLEPSGGGEEKKRKKVGFGNFEGW
jgi:peptidyl-prolyl cis-trans isomerase-like 2